MADKENHFSKNTLRNEEQEKPPASKKAIKSKKAKKEIKSTSKSKTLSQRFAFLKDERVHKVTGLFLLILAFYLMVAFISYLQTWKLDDHLFSRSFSSLLFDKTLVIENWMGRMGAFLFVPVYKEMVRHYLISFWTTIAGDRIKTISQYQASPIRSYIQIFVF